MNEELGFLDYACAIAIPILIGLMWWSIRRYKSATISTSEWRLRMKEQGLGLK